MEVTLLLSCVGDEADPAEGDNLLQGAQKISDWAGQVELSPEPGLLKPVLVNGLEREF